MSKTQPLHVAKIRYVDDCFVLTMSDGTELKSFADDNDYLGQVAEKILLELERAGFGTERFGHTLQ